MICDFIDEDTYQELKNIVIVYNTFYFKVISYYLRKYVLLLKILKELNLNHLLTLFK